LVLFKFKSWLCHVVNCLSSGYKAMLPLDLIVA
jgi:hypothetical protein